MLPAHTKLRAKLAVVAFLATLAPLSHAAEHITLANGFELDCLRREAVGDRIRLFFAGSGQNYMDVAAAAIVRVEIIPDPPPAAVLAAESTTARVESMATTSGQPTPVELTQMLAKAGAQHNIDAELLASVMHAESGGHVQAVSRTGARGLMQLMPGTAAALGVLDPFVAGQSVEGGTKYLDQLLTRYHDNIALALAAYNAGPGAVDKYHGIPPFRETRAYVARVIREFNRRKTTLVAQAK